MKEYGSWAEIGCKGYRLHCTDAVRAVRGAGVFMLVLLSHLHRNYAKMRDNVLNTPHSFG